MTCQNVSQLHNSTLQAQAGSAYRLNFTKLTTDLDNITAQISLKAGTATVTPTLTNSTNSSRVQVFSFEISEADKTTLLAGADEVTVEYRVTVTFPNSNSISGEYGDTAYRGTFDIIGPSAEVLNDATAPTASLVGTLTTPVDAGSAFNVIIDYIDETSFNPATVSATDLTAISGVNSGTVTLVSSTVIPNGIRTTFSVVLPVAGNYDLEISNASFADTAGNLGATVVLGTVTAESISLPASTDFDLSSSHSLVLRLI